MATQFHEGQEVEVHTDQRITGGTIPGGWRHWRTAKIVGVAGEPYPKNSWEIQFQDGFHAVFDAAHIRAIDKYEFAGAIQRARSANQIP